jgi:signal transduction histidine kinase
MSAFGRRLSTRLVVVFCGMLAGIGAFMIVFFPRGMAAQAERSTEARAVSIVEVMATAVAPALEFDDAEHATAILGWLASTSDARFAVLRRNDGAPFATWHPERIPAGLDLPTAFRVRVTAQLLVASIPVRAVAGGEGTLHVAFSLDALARERKDLQRTVAVVAGLVVLVGVVATLLAVTLIVRPIRRLTVTARKIAAGELPPELPKLAGTEEIAELAVALRAMIERMHEQNQQELLQASRHAGMAEVATGVLHNVGNILNSVNVTVELMREGDRGGSVQRISQLRDVLAKLEPATLDATRIAALVKFTEILVGSLEAERAASVAKLETLRGHIDHIKRVVAMQNAYARQTSVVEATRLRALVDEACEIAVPPSRRAALALHIDTPDAIVRIDRHRALQIIVNLIANARDAVSGVDGSKEITIACTIADDKLVIAVRDSGIGFTAETGRKLFAAGFTTKPHGHGYGLHSSALAARQLGGELLANSEGAGRGATFSLVLPSPEVT